ncbi:MAG: hypothetical protein VX644_05605 [Planctomycetota bacterium]|nr:hypothetical protein [Planctomycetota bacterium]
MPSYLLPCTCGKSIPVTKLQAGQEVACECGQFQVAPTLRAIQKLPELEAVVSRQRLVKEPWSASRTSTFAAGLVVVALATAAVVICQVKVSGIKTGLPTKKEMKAYEEDMNTRIIEGLDPLQSYDQFLTWKKMGLGEPISRKFEEEHAKLDKVKWTSRVFSALALVGLLITLGAMLWPRRSMESS